MHESLLVLAAVFPVYLIVALGASLRRWQILSPGLDQGLMFLAVNVFFPCLILDKMIGAEVLRDPSVVFSSAGIGLVLILVAMAIGWLIAPLLGLASGGDLSSGNGSNTGGKRTFAVAAGLQNYGYMAIPLVIYLFPDDNVMAVLFTHNLGVEIAMWTVGLMLLSGNRKLSYKVLMKAPIIAMVVGLFLALSHLDSYVPAVMTNTFEMLGQCAVPLSLLLVGTTWYDLLAKASMSWRVSLGGIVVRLFLAPILFLLLGRYLPLATELKQVLVVQAALPSAMFPIVLSKHYGGKTEIAIEVVIATTAVSLLTMPFVISFGRYWLEL